MLGPIFLRYEDGAHILGKHFSLTIGMKGSDPSKPRAGTGHTIHACRRNQLLEISRNIHWHRIPLMLDELGLLSYR